MNDRTKRIVIISGSILFLLILVLILSPSGKKVESIEPSDTNTVNEVKDYKDIIVKSVIHKGDTYNVIVRQEINKSSLFDVLVYKNGSLIGKSDYSSVPVEAEVLEFKTDLTSTYNSYTESELSLESSVEGTEESVIESVAETDLNSEEVTSEEEVTSPSTETIANTEIEEESSEETINPSTETIANTDITEEENSSEITNVEVSLNSNTVYEEYISFENIEEKAVEEGLLYETDLDTNIKFVNSLLSDGYELETQISTSVYNDIYLVGKDNSFRIVIALNKPLMIISEITDLEIDIDKILNIHHEGEN